MSDMTCKELVELVTAYLEDDLDDETVRSVEHHLAACPGCETYLQQFRETIDALGELPVESVTPEAERKIMEAFRGWRDERNSS